MESQDRHAFLERLQAVELEVIKTFFTPPMRHLDRGWTWGITLRGEGITSGAMLVHLEGKVEVDPANRDLRHFIKKIADDHGVKVFPVDSTRFGHVSITKDGEQYTLFVDADDW